MKALWSCLLLPLALAVSAPADSARHALPKPDSLAADSLARDTAAPPAYRVVEQGPVSVAAKLLPRRGGKPLTVGDRFKLELVVKRHRDFKMSGPFPESLGAFLVLGGKQAVKYRGDTVIDRHELEMAAFAPGELALPRFLVTFADSGEVRAVRADSLGLKIQSVMPDNMKDVNELKPQIQFPNLLPLWLLLGVVAAAGLGYAAWRLRRFFIRKRLWTEPLPEPWEEALAALEKIPAKDWLSSGQVKRYYYAVSEILKRYLTRRFNFPALDQTTSEMVLEMKRARVELREEFAGFFRRADMVKYAKLVPEMVEMEAVIPTARDLVQRTTPKLEQEVNHQDTKSTKAGEPERKE